MRFVDLVVSASPARCLAARRASGRVALRVLALAGSAALAACGGSDARPDAASHDGAHAVVDSGAHATDAGFATDALDASVPVDVATPSDAPHATDARVPADAARPLDCVASPHVCGYPDETNTGVPAGVTLRRVPADVTSGTGWTWDARYGDVNVTGDDVVLDGLEIHGSVEAYGARLTVRNCRIVATGETWGVGLRHANDATVQDTEIQSPVANGSDRLAVGIKDIYGDTTGTHVQRANIFHTSTGIQIANGVFEDNYIHDYGYATGDHLNGVSVGGGDVASLVVRHNTIFDDHDQTDAIALFQDFGTEANKTLDDNFVAGGSYCIYGGHGAHATTNIRITNNRIAVRWFPNGGTYGWLAAWTGEPGNVLAGNYWDDTGHSADADFTTHR